MDDMDRRLKQLEEQVQAEEKPTRKSAAPPKSPAAPKDPGHPVAELLIGLVLIGAGVFWILNSFVVSFSWGSLWTGFGISAAAASGLMLVPLLIGIALLFFLDHKWIAWVVVAIGILAILVTLLTSVRFRPVSASLWQYVVMFGMVAAGVGLTLKALLKKRD